MVGAVEKSREDLKHDIDAFDVVRSDENMKGKTVLLLVNKNVIFPQKLFQIFFSFI